MMKYDDKKNIMLILALSSVSSITWVLTSGRYINGDEAVIGLMALKISQGIDFPLFYWKAHYSGPIASYLAAPLHRIWPPSGPLLHSAVIPFHVLYACGIYLLARKWLEKETALVAGLLSALPAHLFPYSALGGYTESISLIPWILLLCLGREHTLGDSTNERARFFFGGFLCGLAVWIFPIAIPTVTASLFFVYRRFEGRSLRIVIYGCLLAISPVVYYNISHPGVTILRLMARPLAVDKQGFTTLTETKNILQVFETLLQNWAGNIYKTLLNIPASTLELFGITHQESIWNRTAGAISLLGFLIALIVLPKFRGDKKRIASALFAMVILNYAFFLFFGMDRYRYLIPVLTVAPFGLAICLKKIPFLQRRPLLILSSLIILAIHGISNVVGPSLELSDNKRFSVYLQEKGLTRGYASYFLAYQLVYLSRERLIFSPALHTPDSDRYDEYTHFVSTSKNPVFINMSEEKARFFREKLRHLNISAKVLRWENYTVFYQLNPRVNIEDLKE